MKVSNTVYILSLSTVSVSAFSSLAFTHTSNSFGLRTSTPVTSTLLNAGFGGGGGGGMSSKKKGGKKSKNASSSSAGIKLKPKPQWDRYGKELKKATATVVAVRVANDGTDDKGDWYEVGRIKSEDNQFTDIAVAMQRGIIAEHAKRLFPLQFTAKDKVEWGYSGAGPDVAPEQGDWVVVDKSVANDAPSGTEKKIGFEGKPDAGTGFYCHYEGGRMVDKYDNSLNVAILNPSTKELPRRK
mmetsp:Transcript_29532/g.45078  ORF Transcript_29532/g.45078 Transcript_29532/m.45078 type:complete len:241 (+) Transcript_29532:90-812(+)|eukprot:CAMPEP_0194075822 /NCGR_PEP_ID=MMETSP0149-20130528/2747_1 /TAXON_ID=122233 /ORGANISM="Chaetoceros debilis, Strain MM31A-1" /LENGTH=240 /DNA_ID=CAMNT_0038756407 /DNA_START=40 /DNA_END=762 /DNA_ORIENTATION=-